MFCGKFLSLWGSPVFTALQTSIVQEKDSSSVSVQEAKASSQVRRAWSFGLGWWGNGKGEPHGAPKQPK